MTSIFDVCKATLAVGALSATLLGCQSDPDDVSFRAIRGDLTPELAGQYERPDDISRNMAVDMNLEKRMIWDDLRRVFFLDHPTRLSPFPVLMTSGSPR